MNPTELKTKLIGIPTLAVLIFFLFLGEQCAIFSSTFFIGIGICIFITTVMWLGNAEIFDRFHQKMPLMEDTMKRTLLIAIFCLIYSILGYISTKLLIDYVFPNPHNNWDSFWFDFKITLIFTTLLVVVSETVYFFEQWKKTLIDAERLKRENNQAQLDSLRNQVNPHFLFNSLNTLISIIPDCPETAIDFTQKLSNVYRYLLSVREKELVELQTELDFIQSYIFLLKVRFDQNLVFQIDIQDELKTRLLPPVSLQLLIENAIKHNIVSREKPLYIQMYVENDFLIIKNNLQAKLEKEASTGIGLENIRKRYQILSTKQMEVIHSSTHFTIALPLLTNK
jgi:two-component system, LytTR family, sensor kinase